MLSKSKLTKTASKRRWLWYLCDIGNSAYAAVVILAVYAAYFKGHVVGGAEGSRLWGISVGIAMRLWLLSHPYWELSRITQVKRKGC